MAGKRWVCLNSVLDVANMVDERPVGVAMNTGDVDDDTG